MDTTSFIAAFAPSKILITTSVLPVIDIDPTKSSWLGDFLDPKIYAVVGGSIIKIDPKAGAVSLSSADEVAALPNNWANIIALVLAAGFAIAVVKRLIKR